MYVITETRYPVEDGEETEVSVMGVFTSPEEAINYVKKQTVHKFLCYEVNEHTLNEIFPDGEKTIFTKSNWGEYNY